MNEHSVHICPVKGRTVLFIRDFCKEDCDNHLDCPIMPCCEDKDQEGGKK